MEQSPSHADARHAADTGRVAIPEIAELLHLQRPAAVVAAAVVVLAGLVVSLVLPAVLPPNAVTGFVVGLLALFAAVAAAVVLDGRDPVVRGPRHLRRDGHAVLARMAGPDPIEHAGPVLTALQRRMAERNHLSIAITGTGTDPSELAEALGRGAAAAGHTSLVIDLRAAGAPGVADVGAGTVRLGEAASLADDRPYAWIGGGADRAAAVTAAAGVARRPPRDLELLLVVAPEAATHTPELLRACDRTLLLVAADTQQRAMVSARLDALERAGGTPEAVVIGGLQVGTSDQQLDEVAATPNAGRGIGAAFGGGAARIAATTPASDTSTADAPEDATRAVPEALDADAGERRPTPFTTAPDEVVTPPAPPAPPSPPATPPPPPPVSEADTGTYDEDDVDVFASTSDGAAPVDVEDDDVSPDASDDDVPGEEAPAIDLIELEGLPDDGEPDDDLSDAAEPADDEPSSQAAPAEPAEPATDPDATGPIRPIAFRTTGGGVDLDGFAESDPMVTTAALEQLLRRHDGDA